MPGQYALDYINWFYLISHSFLSPTYLGDPVRHPPIVQDDTYVELDIPQYPMVTIAMEEAPAYAPSHVEQPLHAVVTYIFILLFISFYLNMQYGYTLSIVVNVIGGLPSNS